MLMLKPILCTPNFQKWFKLAMDASDIGARAIVLQEDVNEVEHPVYYFSKKFQKGQKKIIAIVKELLTLELAPNTLKSICHLEGTQ